MKKFVALCLAFALAVCFASCRGDEAVNDTTAQSAASTASNDESGDALEAVVLTVEMLPHYSTEDSLDGFDNGFNPWTAQLELDTLPIMKKADRLLTPLDATQRANEIAISLGLTLGTANVHNVSKSDFLATLSCSEGFQSVSVSVDELGGVTVIYYDDNGKAVPEEHKDDKLAWLIDTYFPLFFDGKTVKCQNGDFGAVYLEGNDERERLINYFFNNLSFSEKLRLDYATMKMLPTGALGHVTVRCSDGYTQADYPILGFDGAKKLFTEGKAYTRAAVKDGLVLSDEDIEYATLIYDTEGGADTVIPYYCFWVRTENEGEQGYSAFYVPAIAPEYMDTSEIDAIIGR